MAAAGAWKAYENFKLNLGKAIPEFNTATFKMALFLSTSNCDTLSGSNVYGDLTNEVATAYGYTAGGITLSGVTWANTSGTSKLTFTAPVWTASGGSIVARSAVIYQSTTVNSLANMLVCTCLLDATPADVTATTGNTLTVTPSGSGVITISGATSN